MRVFSIFQWPPGCRNFAQKPTLQHLSGNTCPSNRQKSPVTAIAPAASRPPSPVQIREIRAYVPGRKERERKEKKRDNATRLTLGCCNKQKQKSKKEEKRGKIKRRCKKAQRGTRLQRSCLSGGIQGLSRLPKRGGEKKRN